MDFHQLLAKMQQLDQPVKEASIEECGEPMGQMPPVPNAPVTTPPSLSVNLNAQGLDNIEDILKLITKVNPDAVKPMEPGLPSLTPTPGIASISPAPSMSPSLPPLKMLPDLDAEPGPEAGADLDLDQGPEMPGGDEVSKPEGDLDNDGDHDMDDHEMEKDDESEEGNTEPDEDDEEQESFGNSFKGSEPEYKDASFSTHDGNDLNKSKGTYPKVAGGDNPMQKNKFESGDLRAQIRAELLQRLEEAKGAK